MSTSTIQIPVGIIERLRLTERPLLRALERKANTHFELEALNLGHKFVDAAYLTARHHLILAGLHAPDEKLNRAIYPTRNEMAARIRKGPETVTAREADEGLDAAANPSGDATPHLLNARAALQLVLDMGKMLASDGLPKYHLVDDYDASLIEDKIVFTDMLLALPGSWIGSAGVDD